MSAPFTDVTWVVPLSVFIAGFVGSPHCLSMCGPLVLSLASDRKRMIAYQTGRMLSYSLAGLLAGALTQSALPASPDTGLALISLSVIALVLVLTGWRSLTGQPWHVPMPKALKPLLDFAWSLTAKLPPKLGTLFAGALTVFLPCGHLWGFLIGAAATGSALKGAAFMWTFWLSTVPALGFGSSILRRFITPGSVQGKRWAGALLVLAGLFSIGMFAARLHDLQSRPPGKGPETLICH